MSATLGLLLALSSASGDGTPDFSAAATAGLFGVPTHGAGAEPGPLFACGGGLLIPLSHVDDDYCDCEDGSDEPRTGACNDASFTCTLPRGVRRVTVPASRVDDGVCDCCDGSDEWRSAAQCPSRCHRVAPGGRAWMVAGALALACALVGSACLCMRQPQAVSELEVTLAKPEPQAKLGLGLGDAPSGHRHGWPEVALLEAGSIAAHSALQLGDALTAVNGQPARGREGASVLLHVANKELRLAVRRTAPEVVAPGERRPTRAVVVVLCACAAWWPLPLAALAAPAAPLVGSALAAASVGAHSALWLATQAQEAVGRACLLLAAAGLAAALLLLSLAVPPHAVGAPALLTALLAADAAAFAASRASAPAAAAPAAAAPAAAAAHAAAPAAAAPDVAAPHALGELPPLLAHALALPPLLLLADDTADERLAGLGLALLNFVLKLLPPLWPPRGACGACEDAPGAARLGLRLLALLALATRGVATWWAAESFYRAGERAGTTYGAMADEL